MPRSRFLYFCSITKQSSGLARSMKPYPAQFPDRKIFKAFVKHRTLKPETRACLERVAAENGKKVMAHLTQELMRDMVRGLPNHTTEPKLLCHGDYEIRLIQNQMKRWHNECPESKLKIIENAHHIANQDNPGETNRLLLDFLDSI